MDMDALFGDLLDNGAAKDQPPIRLEAKTAQVSERPRITPSKRPQSLSAASNEDSASRRIRAFEAALGLGNKSWGDDVHLTSVSGYHNEDAEIEL